jgi:hypothetical protein
MAEDRRGFLVIVAAVIGGVVVKAGDELVRVLDDFWFLLVGADDAAEAARDQQTDPDSSEDPSEMVPEGNDELIEDLESEESSQQQTQEPDSTEDIEDIEVNVPVLSVDERISLEPEEYYYWEFSAESTVRFTGSFTVTSGPSVELYVMDQWEFVNYETGSSYEYEGTAPLAESNSVDVTLQSGEYVAVVENPCTFCGLEGSGPETSQVRVEMTAE